MTSLQESENLLERAMISSVVSPNTEESVECREPFTAM